MTSVFFHLETLDEGLGPSQLHRCSWDRVRGTGSASGREKPLAERGAEAHGRGERRALRNYENVGGV